MIAMMMFFGRGRFQTCPYVILATLLDSRLRGNPREGEEWNPGEEWPPLRLRKGARTSGAM